MNTKYCVSCGRKNDYTLSEGSPKKCLGCGESMEIKASAASIIQSQPAPVKQYKSPTRLEVDFSQDDDEPTEKIPQLSKAAVEIQLDKPEPMKFGNVVQTGGTGYKPRKGKKIKNVLKYLEEEMNRNAPTEDLDKQSERD